MDEWTQAASCCTEIVTQWWSQWPMANVGVATGAGSGIVVFDFDGEDGAQTLLKLAGEDPSIRNTLIHQSGSGGTHLFYRHPGGLIGNAVKVLPGMDIRADDGLIILPPSRHKSGMDYGVQSGKPIASLPESLQRHLHHCHKEEQGVLRIVEERQSRTRQGRGRKGSGKGVLPKIAKDLLEGALQASLPTGAGMRHRQVFKLAQWLLSIPGMNQEISVTHFRSIVARWHQMALEHASSLGFAINGDIEESWTDFQNAWGRVKHPIGPGLIPVFDEIRQKDSDSEIEPQVWNALAYFGRTEDLQMRLLTSVLFELSQRACNEPFSLACNIGAEHLRRIGADAKISGNWVYRRLKTFERDGIIRCLDPGQSGGMSERRAAQYRWIWTEKDPPDDPFG